MTGEPDDEAIEPGGEWSDAPAQRSPSDATMAIERLVEDPSVHEPILVVQLDGWIDASEAARGAADLVDEYCQTSPIIRFDDDTYIDYRARRPVLELRDGLSTNLAWPVLELRAGRTPGGRDVVTLRGPEPDTAWRRFGRSVVTLAIELGIAQMVGFGAYPFAAPHTRPSRLSVSSPSTEVLARTPFLRSSVDVPAGAEALLEHALHAAKIPAIGLWAQVPHYAATAEYAPASLALLDGLRVMTGVEVQAGRLAETARQQTDELDSKMAESSELHALLTNLEELYDRTITAELGAGSDPDDRELELRSGDELAAEIQQFLRDQD